MKQKCEVWDYYTRVDITSNKFDYSCNYCGITYTKNATRQTRHLIRCAQCPLDIKQKLMLRTAIAETKKNKLLDIHNAQTLPNVMRHFLPSTWLHNDNSDSGLPSELCHKCGSSTRVVIRKKTSADGYVQEYDTRRCTKKGCQAYKIIGQGDVSNKNSPWLQTWEKIGRIVSKVENINRTEADCRKKWTYLKWEAKNTSKPTRDPVSKAVFNILVSKKGQPVDVDLTSAAASEAFPQSYAQAGSLSTSSVSTTSIESATSSTSIPSSAFCWTPSSLKIENPVFISDDNEVSHAAYPTLICRSILMDAGTEDNVFAFIRIRTRRHKFFTGRKNCSKNQYRVILNKLNLQGCVTIKQLQSKWQNLIYKYKEIKIAGPNNKPDEMVQNDWPYFSILDDFMTNRSENLSDLANDDSVFEAVVGDYVNASSSKSLPASYQKAIGSQKAGLPNQSFVPKLCKTSPTPGTSRPQQMRIAPKPQSPIPTPMLVPIPSPVQVSQDVCLRWNSYHTNMQNSFPMLLDTEQFVDVTLACEGQFIKCHKMVLSACSTFFNDLLSQNPCQHPIIVLRGSRMWEVRALVDFMYRGEVNVAQDKLASLLSAAEEFQVKGLAGSSSKAPDSSPSGAPIKADVSDLGSDAGEEIHNSPPKKMFKRKMATNPSYNDHRPTSSQPSRPLQRIKIKPLPPQHRGESPEPSDAFPITHEALTTQQHKRIKNETNNDNEPSTSRRDNTQIKEECMEFEDFDMGSNSGSFADQNYSQNDSQYDNENSSDPLNTG